MSTLVLTIIILSGIGVIAALLLYVAARKFYVYENPKIAQIEEYLPGANCGSCGLKGCHDFAKAVASATSLEGLNCPGAGEDNMKVIAKIAGLEAVAVAPLTAVVRCNGACGKRKVNSTYDGARRCAIEAAAYSGDSDCAYGCLGCGDCVLACPYDAMRMDPETQLPVVDRDKCVGCGRCVDACPHGIMELIEKKNDVPEVWVACKNHDKGGVALKECEVACIGCGKCMKVCESAAVKVTAFLADINSSKCLGCLKCVEACPRQSIHFQGNKPS